MNSTSAISRRTALRWTLAAAPVVAGFALPGSAGATQRSAPTVPTVPAPASIEIIDAVANSVATASAGADLRPAAGTAGTIRYEDVYRSGMSLQDVFNKAGSTGSPAKQVLLTFPAGEFSFSDFSQNNMYGIRIPLNVGIAGSGRDGINATVFKMVPMSSTKASQVPVKGSGMTNQFTYMGIQNSGLVKPPSGMTFQNFALIGSDQGHLYNGFRMQNCDRPVMTNVYIEGIAGNMAAPPGETFGINLYQAQGAQLTNVEVDGRRTRQGGTESVGASPVGHNNHNDSVMTNCYFHDSQYGMPTFWQSSGNLTVDCRSEYNKTGFNHERCTNITHRNVTVKTGGTRPHHFTFMNDQADGSLTVQNPSWDVCSASPSGKLVVYAGARGTGVQDVQTTSPAVTGASGQSIMSQVLVAGN